MGLNRGTGLWRGAGLSPDTSIGGGGLSPAPPVPPAGPEIVVTGTFTPPAWNFVGSVLDQNFDGDVLDLSLAETITFIDVTGINGYFRIWDGGETVLTSIDISSLSEVTGDIDIESLPALIVLDASGVSSVGGILYVGFHDLLASMPDFAALTEVVGDIIFTGNPVLATGPNFPVLTSAASVLIEACAWVTAPSLSLLESTTGNLVIKENSALEVIPDFAALTSVGGELNVRLNPVLEESPGFPLLETSGEINFDGNTAMTMGPDFPAILAIAGDVTCAGCALDETSVDRVLVQLAALDGTGGTTSYDGFTVDLSGGTNATPGTSGLAAKTTLEGRGNTVLVN